MSIRYTNNCDQVNWIEVSSLFDKVKWGTRQPDVVQSTFEKSSFCRFAYANDKLVGVGRTVDDGAYYAWIVDLAVLPEYQGKGIGSYILKELECDLKPYITTMLTAASGKNSFYEKLGWVKQSSAYIWPRSESQKHAFAEKV